MDFSISTLSHASGTIAFALVSIFIFARYFRRTSDRALFIASLISSAWLAILTVQAIGLDVPFYVRYTSELIRSAAWFGVLYALLELHFLPQKQVHKTNFYLANGVVILLCGVLLVTLYEGVYDKHLISGHAQLIIHVAISLVGLLMIEQVWRNASSYSRSGIKYLVIAMASLFGYDFFLYSDALLFGEMSPALWDSRGFIHAIAVPFIVLSMIKSQGQPSGIHVSRQMVFHTTTLVIAGVYLIFISAGGYYISIFGGTWGEALRVLFIFIGLLSLVLLLSSPLLRAKIMVFISKNFFDYKYDYREEWINSTNALANIDADKSIPKQIIRVLGSLVGCQSGAIWSINDEGQFIIRYHIDMPEQKFEEIDGNADLPAFFKQHDWVINLDEYMHDPTNYNLIEIPESMLSHERPWLIVPLGRPDNLVGMVLLCSPLAELELNWENYDLLRIVSQQAASYLEQTDSQDKLAAARQFEAVNKTSAFLVHDIKTIIAQLSLLVKNAEKHKSNPAFVDDMIRTTSHTVEKMDHLLKQIRNPVFEANIEHVNLSKVLLEIYQNSRNNEPSPIMEYPDDNIWLSADHGQLKSAIEHILQNAIEATPKDGEVSVTTKLAEEYVYIFVQDTGIGMNEDYINNHLFTPFESTKGLTGMGIGVYQSREYLRTIGGSISVTSEEKVGTCFTLKLPIEKKSSDLISGAI